MKVIGIILALLLVAGCDNSQNKSSSGSLRTSDEQKAADFVDTTTGVWSGADSGLVTIDYRNNTFRLIIGDDPKEVRLGDVDTENETANLILRRASDNHDIIWTVHRIWNHDKTSFSLALITDDGSRIDLSFVRKITADDINRIDNLYTRSGSGNVSTAGNEAASSSGSTDSTSTEAGTNAQQPDTPASGDQNTVQQGTSTPATPSRPSFDCSHSANATESLICSNPELSAEDAHLGALYVSALAAQSGDQIRDEQRYWLKFVRAQCPDVACLKQAYDSRVAQLTAEAIDSSLNAIASPTDVQSVANRFYEALGRGDGQTASSLVIPAKRDGGPLSPSALSHFYGTLGSKFIVDNVQSTGPNQATVHYRYFNQARRACVAFSVVTIGERNNVPLVAKLIAPSGC